MYVPVSIILNQMNCTFVESGVDNLLVAVLERTGKKFFYSDDNTLDFENFFRIGLFALSKPRNCIFPSFCSTFHVASIESGLDNLPALLTPSLALRAARTHRGFSILTRSFET